MKPALLLAAVSLAAGPAQAAACWFEGGVVVIPAKVAGVAGDYILDTGAPATLLHETRAQMEGHDGPALHGAVEVAGLSLTDRPVAVTDLDARTRAFPTPIAGVIGADVLAGRVVDIAFAPCRVEIWTPGQAPPFRPDSVLAMARGVPVVTGAVADGPRSAVGGLVVATGLDTPVRLDQALASIPGAQAPDVAPFGPGRARLRALSLAGELFENLPAGLTPPMEGAIGMIGGPVLARWRLRFDFARDRLLLRHRP